MTLSRRQFVQHGTGVLVGSAVSARSLWGMSNPAALQTNTSQTDIVNVQHCVEATARAKMHAQLADRAAMRALASKAIDAARQAGATYADARLTRTVAQSFVHRAPTAVGVELNDNESLAVGVRALVDGYWGFAASPYWDADEVARLARDAVAQAKVNASVGKRPVNLGPSPATTGDWTMPGIDPFTITIEEKTDLMNSWRQAVNDTSSATLTVALDVSSMSFVRQERVLVSTDGTSVAQTTYTTMGSFPIVIRPAMGNTDASSTVGASGLDASGKGWELFTEAKIPDQIPAMLDRGAAFFRMPVRGVEIGQYDVVFDAASMADLTASTIGLGTQLDRALGYEANAGGTSYLGPDPLALLGTFQLASPLVTVTAERSAPGSPATVAWDEDGVKPESFTLVKDGVLVDYQTTREQAAWLAPWYQKQGMPARSHGCAAAESALRTQLQMSPNINMHPGRGTTTFDDMVAGTKRGLAIMSGSASVDFQGRSGLGGGLVREITNGKLGAVYDAAGYLFNTIDLWKNITAVGGAETVEGTTTWLSKGQPNQTALYRTTAVPAAVRNVNIVNRARRA